MSKHKLLIVDDSEEFPMALSEILHSDYQVLFCLDGKEALTLLHSFQPDILLLELMIPNLDGISLLQAAADEGIHPVVLTFTRFYNEFMLSTLTRLNVSYCMVKPCDVYATARRIQDLIPLIGQQHELLPDPAEQASKLLLSLGFSTKHQGYTYLLEALVMEAQIPEQAVTKHLYPAIAAKLNVVTVNVEHAIRTAIQSAWRRGDEALWQQYFPKNADGITPRPSNAKFISRMAQELRQK